MHILPLAKKDIETQKLSIYFWNILLGHHGKKKAQAESLLSILLLFIFSSFFCRVFSIFFFTLLEGFHITKPRCSLVQLFCALYFYVPFFPWKESRLYFFPSVCVHGSLSSSIIIWLQNENCCNIIYNGMVYVLLVISNVTSLCECFLAWLTFNRDWQYENLMVVKSFFCCSLPASRMRMVLCH